MVEVVIEGRRLDVFDGLDFSFNYSIADIRDPSKRSTSYTKTIKCPSTPSNDELFGHIYDVNISNPNDPTAVNIDVNFNPNKKVSADVLSDGIRVMTGTLQLRRIVKHRTKYTYEVVFIGQLIDIFAKLGDRKLAGLDDDNVRLIDFSDIDHTYNMAEQAASWTAAIGEGYVYPMVDNGLNNEYSPNGHRINKVTDMRPALYLKEIVDRIFEYAGFTYTSTFFNSTFFKRLIIPTVSDMGLSDDQVEPRQYKAVKVYRQLFHRLQSQTPLAVGDETRLTNTIPARLCFEDDYLTGFDNNGQYVNLSTVGNLQGTVNNYAFICQETQRNDLFRCSVDFKIKKNFAFGPTLYVGVIQIISVDTLTGSTTIIAEEPWVWDLTIGVGTSVTQTIYLEGEHITNFNDQVSVRIIADDPDYGWKPDFDIYNVTNNYYHLDYRCIGGCFDNVPVQDMINEGDTTDINNGLPDVQMKDMMVSVFNMFNLYITPNINEDNNLIIETRDDFYADGEVIDWTKKLDYDSPIILQPLALLTARKYEYTYTEDDDYYNDRYQSNHNHVHGRRLYEVDNDFLPNTKETKIIFSPSPLVNDGYSNRIIPKIYDSDMDDGIRPMDANIRVLYYAGLLTSNPHWHHAQVDQADVNRFDYPYAGHLTHPITPAQDIHFGLPLELFYTANDLTGPISVTTKNLFNTFYLRHLKEITDKDSKMMTAKVRLSPIDINQLDFRNQIVIDNSLWRLNKVENYNPFKDGLTKVELIKVIDKGPQTFESVNVGGTGTVGGEKLPSTNLEKRNSNHFPDFQGKVKGRRNKVGDNSTAFNIVGDDNKIGQGNKNITIFGNNNTVEDGLNDVVIINSDGFTVTTSNTTIIDGRRQWVEIAVTADYTPNDREVVLVDASAGPVIITMTMTDNYWINVKKIDSTANTVTITSAFGTIDGAASQVLSIQYDAVDIYADGTNAHIRSHT